MLKAAVFMTFIAGMILSLFVELAASSIGTLPGIIAALICALYVAFTTRSVAERY